MNLVANVLAAQMRVHVLITLTIQPVPHVRERPALGSDLKGALDNIHALHARPHRAVVTGAKVARRRERWQADAAEL